jgi:patatin-like phospholipase/acyl hydrolase
VTEERRRAVRILAVDGGGIRGIVPAIMLAALQRRLERPVSDYFDVIAGTSTGGLIAAALCTPGPDGGPRYDTGQILGFYTDDCREIFHRSLWHALISIDGLRRPKYPSSGMRRFLSERFGDLQLTEARRLLMLVTYDITRRRPFVFCSARAVESAAKNFRVSDACLATTAAPTYFPAATIRNLAGEERPFVDGGVCSNDPMLPAFVEADKEFPGRPVLMVSLGTGNLTDPLGIHGARRWGAARWATQILDVLMDGQSGMSENCLDHLVKSRERPGSDYFRLQPDIPAGLGRLDDTSAGNVAGLQEVAAAYCRDQSAVLDGIASALRTAGNEALTA